jgi:hypothetical protein
MKISILGAGNLGGTLGCCWARKGHNVFFGVPRSKDAKTQELLKTIGSMYAAEPWRKRPRPASPFYRGKASLPLPVLSPRHRDVQERLDLFPRHAVGIFAIIKNCMVVTVESFPERRCPGILPVPERPRRRLFMRGPVS